MEKNKLIELRKKLMALGTIGALGLTGITGCGNVKRETVPTVNSETTVSVTTEAPTEAKNVEVTRDMATKEYMAHAKAVAKSMYNANKVYFDKKQYTVEDLERLQYTLNDKNFDENHNLLMDKVAKDRTFDIARELLSPQEYQNMLHEYSRFKHGEITREQYLEKVKECNFYDYNNSLANFIDDNEDNKDIRKFANKFSMVMNRATKKIEACVDPDDSPEEDLTKLFEEIRAAQTGDTSEYKDINYYLTETTTNPGYSFFVAGAFKSVADQLNPLIDGHFIVVKTKDANIAKGYEVVRIGFSKDEQTLVNAYNEGDLVETKAILKAKELNNEEYQTHLYKVMCYEYESVMRLVYGVDNEYATKNTKTYTR